MRPDLHDRVLDALVAAEKNRLDANGGAYVNPAASILTEVPPQYLPICSDDAIIRYTKETVTVLERLEADPSDICHECLHSHGAHVDMSSVLGKGGLERLMDGDLPPKQSSLVLRNLFSKAKKG